MFSDWALANLGTIHDEPLFHKKWKFFGLFFNISCWGDEILKRKSLLKKTPMIKALTRNLHYVFKSLAFITQREQSFLKQHSYLHLWFHEKFKISSYYFWLPYAFIGLTKCKLQTMMLMPTQFPTWPIRN